MIQNDKYNKSEGKNRGNETEILKASESAYGLVDKEQELIQEDSC
jgi:hypothetical protein